MNNKILLLIFLSTLNSKKVPILIEDITISPFLEIILDYKEKRLIDTVLNSVNNHKFIQENLREFRISNTEAAIRLKNENIEPKLIKKLLMNKTEITLYEYNGGLFPFDSIEFYDNTPLTFHNKSLLFIDYDNSNELKIKITSIPDTIKNHKEMNKILNLFHIVENQIFFTNKGTKLINKIKSDIINIYHENDFFEYSSFSNNDNILPSFFSKRPILSHIDLPYKFFYFSNFEKENNFNINLPLYTSKYDLKDSGIILFDLIQLPLLLDYIIKLMDNFLKKYEIERVIHYFPGDDTHSDSSIRNCFNITFKTFKDGINVEKKDDPSITNSMITFFFKDKANRLFKCTTLEIEKNSSIYYMDRDGKSKEALSMKFSFSGGISSFLASYLECNSKYANIEENRIFIIAGNSRLRGESFKLHSLLQTNNISSELYNGNDSVNKVLREARNREFNIIIVIMKNDIILHHDTIYHFGMDYNSVLEYLLEKKNGQ